MNGALRRCDLVDEHIEEGAILENLDAIAFHGRAEGKTGKRGDQIVDRCIGIDVQIGIAVTPDRPDDQHEEDDDANDDEQRNRGHGDGSELGHVRFSQSVISRSMDRQALALATA